MKARYLDSYRRTYFWCISAAFAEGPLACGYPLVKWYGVGRENYTRIPLGLFIDYRGADMLFPESLITISCFQYPRFSLLDKFIR